MVWYGRSRVLPEPAVGGAATSPGGRGPVHPDRGPSPAPGRRDDGVHRGAAGGGPAHQAGGAPQPPGAAAAGGGAGEPDLLLLLGRRGGGEPGGGGGVGRAGGPHQVPQYTLLPLPGHSVVSQDVAEGSTQL